MFASGAAGYAPSLGRIFATAEVVQHDWLMTGNLLKKQGVRSLAAEVEQFRLSLRVPKTQDERALAAFRRARAERAPLQLEQVRQRRPRRDDNSSPGRNRAASGDAGRRHQGDV